MAKRRQRPALRCRFGGNRLSIPSAIHYVSSAVVKDTPEPRPARRWTSRNRPSTRRSCTGCALQNLPLAALGVRIDEASHYISNVISLAANLHGIDTVVVGPRGGTAVLARALVDFSNLQWLTGMETFVTSFCF
jgi:hypothetical protein